MAPKTLRERAAELGMKAMGKLFEDPRRAEAIAAAIGGLQRGKTALGGAQQKALRGAGVGAREGFKEAGERDSGLEGEGRGAGGGVGEGVAAAREKAGGG